MNSLNDMVRAYKANPAEAARNAIVMEMLPYLEKRARVEERRRGIGLEQGDALSVATLAVLRALDNWPDDRGGDFKGYADRYITGILHKHRERMFSSWSATAHDQARKKGFSLPQRAGTFELQRGGHMGVIDLMPGDSAADRLPQAAEAFNQFMTLITPAQQHVMQLHYTKQLAVAEIADETGLPVGDVQRLLEDAHYDIGLRMLEAAGVEGTIMATIPEDVLSHGRFAIAAAAEKDQSPEDYVAGIILRDRALTERVMKSFCAPAIVAEARKSLRQNRPSFTPPPPQAHEKRRLARDATIINGARVQHMVSLFDAWKMPNDRSLGDTTRDELESFVIVEEDRALVHRSRAKFYRLLSEHVEAGKTVRECVSAEFAGRLLQKTQETCGVDFSPVAMGQQLAAAKS